MGKAQYGGERVRLKGIHARLDDDELFDTTRIPLTPEGSPGDMLKTLESQTGIQLQLPPGWNDMQKVMDRLRGQHSVSYAALLLHICQEGNFIPVLQQDGMTIAFQKNATKAQVFLGAENILCVLEPVDDMPDIGDRLRLFPDPQEGIASLEHAVSLREPKILVEVSPAGLRQWSDPESKITPRKMQQRADIGCFETGTFVDSDRVVDLRCAVMRDRRIFEVPLDDTRHECGIQAVNAVCAKGSCMISVDWHSTDPNDSPEICWSEMPVTANQYEALDRDGHPLKTTASSIVYNPERHSFGIQLECEKPPHRLRIRGYSSITPYNTDGEHIVITLPPSGRAVPIPPLPAPPIPPEPEP